MIGHNTAAHGEAVLLLLLHEAGVPRALLIWACRTLVSSQPPVRDLQGVQSGPQTLCHFTVNFSSYNVTKSLSFTARMSCVGETLDAMASLGVEEECDDGRTPVSLSRCSNECSLW